MTLIGNLLWDQRAVMCVSVDILSCVYIYLLTYSTLISSLDSEKNARDVTTRGFDSAFWMDTVEYVKEKHQVCCI